MSTKNETFSFKGASLVRVRVRDPYVLSRSRHMGAPDLTSKILISITHKLLLMYTRVTPLKGLLCMAPPLDDDREGGSFVREGVVHALVSERSQHNTRTHAKNLGHCHHLLIFIFSIALHWIALRWTTGQDFVSSSFEEAKARRRRKRRTTRVIVVQG